jgi:hypothetical protein
MGKILDVAASLLSVGAGLYLLQYNEVSTGIGGGTSWFQIIGHGMGIYFIGKGIWMLRSLHLQGQIATTNRKMLELDAHDHVTATAVPAQVD